MTNKFVTFSDRNFENNRKKLCSDVLETGLFEVHEFTERNLPESYLREFPGYPDSRVRGCGYWSWKPWIVMDVLKKSNRGDIIMWCDAGCSLNKSATKNLSAWIETCQDRDALNFSLDHIESTWTKRDLASLLNCDEERYMMSPQIMATLFMLKNNDESFCMVEKWQDLSKLGWAFDDSPSKIPNYKNFIEHRHDQSAWSLIRKLHNSYTQPDVSYADDWNSEILKEVPIWSTRKRG